MRVKLVGDMSGTRHGKTWPKPGTVIDVEDDEAQTLLLGNMAVAHDQPHFEADRAYAQRRLLEQRDEDDHKAGLKQRELDQKTLGDQTVIDQRRREDREAADQKIRDGKFDRPSGEVVDMRVDSKGAAHAAAEESKKEPTTRKPRKAKASRSAKSADFGTARTGTATTNIGDHPETTKELAR